MPINVYLARYLKIVRGYDGLDAIIPLGQPSKPLVESLVSKLMIFNFLSGKAQFVAKNIGKPLYLLWRPVVLNFADNIVTNITLQSILQENVFYKYFFVSIGVSTSNIITPTKYQENIQTSIIAISSSINNQRYLDIIKNLSQSFSAVTIKLILKLVTKTLSCSTTWSKFGDEVGIRTPIELNNIRNNLITKYVLWADIDLSGYVNWEPIGTPTNPFTGILSDDGLGRTISGLTINRPTEDAVGLFGVCCFNRDEPSLAGISIVNADVTGQDNVGALAGKVINEFVGGEGDIFEEVWFEVILECDAAGTVVGRDNVGGLIGYVEGPEFAGWANPERYASIWVNENAIARVVECYSLCNVLGSGINIGGLIGYSFEIFTHKSRAFGTVTGGDIVGGLIGYFYRSIIKWCYATGNITGYKTVGGLLGLGRYRPDIEKSYAEGNVTGTAPLEEHTNFQGAGGVGGLIGETDVNFIHDNYAAGDVSGPYRVGGLIGCCYGGETASPNVKWCYAHGNVSGLKAVGGLIGYIYGYISYPGGRSMFSITRVYCTGSVTGQQKGAVIGEVGRPPWLGGQPGTPDIRTPMFFNSDVNQAPAVNGGEGKTAIELSFYSTYDEWSNFDRVMVIDLDESPFPILKIFYDPISIMISVLRGYDQGLVLAYLNNGKTYYQQLHDNVWGVEKHLTMPEPANTLSLFRTNDLRMGAVVSVPTGSDDNERLHWAVTDINSMALHHSGALAEGSFGTLVHLGNRIKTYYVSSVQTLAEQIANFAGDWKALEFKPAEPLPSDSYISRLRVKQFQGISYFVWRSRGQHRFMSQDEVLDLPEIKVVDEGSITLRMNTPVVSVSLEVNSESKEVVYDIIISVYSFQPGS